MSSYPNILMPRAQVMELSKSKRYFWHSFSSETSVAQTLTWVSESNQDSGTRFSQNKDGKSYSEKDMVVGI